ncbi:MAG: multidrug effflux MFS transporter [Rhodospirillales bacterium]
MPIKRPLLIALVTLCVSLSAASTDMYLPSLPSMAASLGATAADVQLTLSAYMYAYAAAQLVYGPLTDRFGRRPVLLAGMGIYLAASVGCILATSIEMLVALRVIQAFGVCAAPVAGRAAVRDTHEVREAARAMAYVATAFSLTPVFAPLIGGLLETWFGWRSNFVFMAAAGVAVTFAVVVALPETNTRRDRHAIAPLQMARNYARLLSSPLYLGYAGAAAFSFGVIFAYISGAAFVFIEVFALSPALFGSVFGLSAIGFGAASFLSTRLTPRFGIDGTIMIGAGVIVAGGVAMNGLLLAGAYHPATIIATMLIISIGTGFVMPNLQAGALGPFPAMAGAASAMLGCLQFVGASSIGAAVGHAYDGTPYPMTGAMLLSGLALLAVFYALVWRRR